MHFVYVKMRLSTLQSAESLQVSLSLSSGVGAMSTALLLWQFSRLGSAPWLSSSEQTSTRFLDAASWRAVNCQRSIAFTQAPCCTMKEETKLSVTMTLHSSQPTGFTYNELKSEDGIHKN